jgi:hypothetical protein
MARTNPNSNNVQEYNGTAWSTGGSMITTRGFLAGSGTQNAAVGFGGGGLTCTEIYNGTSWSTTTSMITGRDGGSGNGTTGNTGLSVGGSSTLRITEEFNG